MSLFSTLTPILRFFDEDKAKAFYLDFLGFTLVFEHRFDEGLPLYMGIEKGDVTLHLSEHHGDATPGAHLRIHVQDLAAYTSELEARPYKHVGLAIGEPTPWGTREMAVIDPFGNRLTFYEEA